MPPRTPHGFPAPHLVFSGGRTGMHMAAHGAEGKLGNIIELFHYASQPLSGASLFKSGFPHSPWVKLCQLVILINGQARYPQFNNTLTYPFGLTSECELAGIRFSFRILLLNDALVQSVHLTDPASVPHGTQLQLRALWHGNVLKSPSYRTWSSWTQAEGNLYVAIASDQRSPRECEAQIRERKLNPVQNPTFEIPDVANAETFIGLTATQPLTHCAFSGAHENFKHHFTSDDFRTTGEAAIIVCFAPDAQSLRSRTTHLNRYALEEAQALLDTHQANCSRRPRFHLQNKQVQSCLENIPATLDALKVHDIPGAMRAAAHAYWLWSWDSLVHAQAFLLSGEADFLKELLLLCVRHADPALGIPHQLNTRLQPQLAMAFPAQGLFILALYHYYNWTNDQETLQACYPLALTIIDECLKREIAETGLISGTSLYPDFPALLGQNGQDVSVFNNSIFYQALRAMIPLTHAHGKSTKEHKAHERIARYNTIADRACAHFIRHFYDESTGYFFDSLSSTDLSPRRHYPAYALLWNSPFAADLLGEHQEQIAAYMERNFVRPHGLGMFPRSDEAWMRDGNQFGAYYPVLDAFYCQMMKRTGRGTALLRWLDSIGWYWQRLTIPEGVTYEAENEEPDNPGTRQAFSAKAWYAIFFACIAGIEVTEEGLVITPGPAELEATIENINLRGCTLKIRLGGTGAQQNAHFNEKPVCASSHVIPFESLRAVNTLQLRRSAPPPV